MCLPCNSIRLHLLPARPPPAGQVGAVLDVCISSDGTLAVTVSDDFSARVWDLDEDGVAMHVLEGHAGWVTSCAFIGTSHNVITASHVSERASERRSPPAPKLPNCCPSHAAHRTCVPLPALRT